MPRSRRSTTTVGGASVLPTTRTVPHWFGQTTDPHNGVTYGYNMVGADPNHCSGAACSTTVEADITPLIVNIDGLTFDGTAVLGADARVAAVREQRLRVDAGRDRGRRIPERSRVHPRAGRRPLAGRRGVPLQLEDATMRAQFNKTGAEQLPPDPAPERPAGGHDRRAAEPGHADRERPRRRLRRHQHQLVVGADQEPRADGRPDAPADLPDATTCFCIERNVPTTAA